MSDVKETQSVQPALEIKDEGAITQLTRGVAYPFPYYELGVPPYDHFWPPEP